MSGESGQKRTKREKISKFDPNAASKADAGIFGLPFSVDDAEIVVLPVPREVTVSYRAGTAQGPQAIFEASAQIDFFDPVVKDAWKIGIAMADISEASLEESESLRQKATKCIDIVVNESDPELSAELTTLQREIAEKCRGMNQWVKDRSLELMNRGKIVAFDINEVAPAEDNDWDANVAARLLYRISNLVAVSNGRHL